MSASRLLNSAADIAAMLERFLNDASNLNPHEWDDFECRPFKDSNLEAWRSYILKEIGSLVAPIPAGADTILKERSGRIIASLRNNEHAPCQT